MEDMQERTRKIREENHQMLLKYEAFKKFAIENNIPIPAAIENA